MTKAIAARQAGDRFQACWFWHHAIRLISGSECMEKVGFEVDQFKAFDDVAVFYKKPVPDRSGGYVLADFFQTKFHVRGNNCITLEALMNPEFVNATSVSILQRLKNAVFKSSETQIPALFHLVSFWAIDPNDVLYKMVENEHGKIRLEILFDGTGNRSQMGKIRKELRDHLNLTNDSELKTVLERLRINVFVTNIEAFQQDILNPMLISNGMSPVERDRQCNEYESLIWRLHGEGINEFSQSQLIKILETNRLYNPILKKSEMAGKKSLGIRSFHNWSSYLEDSIDELLCLLGFFPDRRIAAESMWVDEITPSVTKFLEKHLKPGDICSLNLEAHSCIAFLAGAILNNRSGVSVEIVQTTLGKRDIWTANSCGEETDESCWLFREQNTTSQSKKIAVAISATHDISSDVEKYINGVFPDMPFLFANLKCEFGQNSVKNGKHAFSLASALSSRLRSYRSQNSIEEFHLFIAAPKGLTFFLGHTSYDIRQFIFYDFDPGSQGKYYPTLRR